MRCHTLPRKPHRLCPRRGKSPPSCHSERSEESHSPYPILRFGTLKSLFSLFKSRFSALTTFLFRTTVLKTFVACRRGVLLETKTTPKNPLRVFSGGPGRSKSSGELTAPPSPRPSLSGTLLAPLSARRYLMRTFSSPFIVGMRQVLQVSEASRHEASFKIVSPPIGAAAPVTSVPAGGYAGLSKRLFICKDQLPAGNPDLAER